MIENILSPILLPEFALDAHSIDLITKVILSDKEKMKALPTDDPLDPKRMRRVEWTLEELVAQPDVISNTLKIEAEQIKETAKYLADKSIENIVLVGCGDSLASMIGVKAAYEKLLGLPTEVHQSLDFAYYNHSLINEKSLVITLSSSGKTPRTIEAMLIARMKKAVIIAMSNTPGSPLMEEADRGILIHAERKGWPTQSSTAAMATMFQLLIEFAEIRGGDPEAVAKFRSDFSQVPELMRKTIQLTDETIHRIAIKERDKEFYLFSAGGPTYAAAIFGSAKVKECSPSRALEIQLEEFHHYNTVKVGDPIFIIAPDGYSVPRAVDTASEAKRWGGVVYSIVTGDNPALDENSDLVLRLPVVDELLASLIYAIPVQQFGYHVAMEKFFHAQKTLKS